MVNASFAVGILADLIGSDVPQRGAAKGRISDRYLESTLSYATAAIGPFSAGRAS
jgi:hypothetical protein